VTRSPDLRRTCHNAGLDCVSIIVASDELAHLANVGLWVVQGLLVAVFGFSAAVKGTQPKQRVLQLGMTGVVNIPLPLMRFTALCEVFGVIGLVLPYATGIAPILTPAAAIGLGMIMIAAAVIHLRLHEPWTAGGNVILLALCVLIAIGRWP
jgi:DoxX-like family